MRIDSLYIKAITAALVLFIIASCARPTDTPGTGPAAIPSSNPGREGTDALIYSGAGAWGLEVDALSAALYEHGGTYQQVTAPELEAFTQESFTKYRMLIFPGGDAWVLTRSLSGAARERVRLAVRGQGLSYLGFCAGAWVAVTPEDHIADQTYGFGIITGPIQEQNYLFKQGRTYALSLAQFPDGRTRELLWYGGPITPNEVGGVAVKYPDGTPAITQLRAGNGFVILSGLHPAVTKETLRSLGLSHLEAAAPEFAWKMIEAGINRQPLPSFP